MRFDLTTTNFNNILSSGELTVQQAIDKIDDHVHNTYFGVDSGSTSNYAITASPAATAYAAGMTVRFQANTYNSGICSINVNSLGAKTIKKNTSTDLNYNDIHSGQLVTVVYDGTNFQMQSPAILTEIQGMAQTVSTDFIIPSNQNGLSVGPISINSGKTVTVTSGSVWTIV